MKKVSTTNQQIPHVFVTNVSKRKVAVHEELSEKYFTKSESESRDGKEALSEGIVGSSLSRAQPPEERHDNRKGSVISESESRYLEKVES